MLIRRKETTATAFGPSVVCSTQRLRCLFWVCCLNPFQATGAGAHWDSKLGNNWNDRREVGLVLTMNYYILKFTLAERLLRRARYGLCREALGRSEGIPPPFCVQRL